MPVVMESCDGRCEFTFPNDIVEIAESIDEVRGIGCTSGRKAQATAGTIDPQGWIRETETRRSVAGCKNGLLAVTLWLSLRTMDLYHLYSH